MLEITSTSTQIDGIPLGKPVSFRKDEESSSYIATRSEEEYIHVKHLVHA